MKTKELMKAKELILNSMGENFYVVTGKVTGGEDAMTIIRAFSSYEDAHRFIGRVSVLFTERDRFNRGFEQHKPAYDTWELAQWIIKEFTEILPSQMMGINTIKD